MVEGNRECYGKTEEGHQTPLRNESLAEEKVRQGGWVRIMWQKRNGVGGRLVEEKMYKGTEE